MVTLTAADWLDAWEQGLPLPVALRPCALLAPLLANGFAAAAALPIGQRDRHLLALHRNLLGSALVATALCPCCGERLEMDLDCDQLILPERAGSEAIELELAGERWQCRLPDSRDLAAIATVGDVEQARQLLLARCLGDLSARAANLPAAQQQQVAAALTEADPQAVIELALACPACGHHWPEIFDIGSFLWEAVDGWAQRTLDQVHLLARAYGWSEPQVLALSPARRARYLERVMA